MPLLSCLERAKPRTLTTPNAGQYEEPQELSFIAGKDAKWYRPIGRQFDKFLIRLNVLLPYDPAIFLLGIFKY